MVIDIVQLVPLVAILHCLRELASAKLVAISVLLFELVLLMLLVLLLVNVQLVGGLLRFCRPVLRTLRSIILRILIHLKLRNHISIKYLLFILILLLILVRFFPRNNN